MTSPINSLLTVTPQQQALMYDQAFRNVLEMHIPIFINGGKVREVTIKPEKAYEFDGDFFGVCRTAVANEAMHWINMRVNGLTHPFQYTSDMLTILVVDEGYVNEIYQRYTMTHKSS